jgi:ArsR family transcriptional regulator, lead/cadmium/zinc/bismuth-responsive transcriptional repressor
MWDKDYKNSLKILKGLSEESRFRIIKILLKGEICACKIPLLIDRTQSNTSMQLSKLQDLGLIKSRRDGKMILYSIKEKKLFDIIKILEK